MNKSSRTDDATACLEPIIEEYADTVYKLAYARTRSKVDAEDIFQEVFLRLVRKKPKFDSKEHEKAWLIRVTLNCCNSFWNRSFRRRTEELNENIPCDSPEEENLQILLRDLRPDYRIIIHLFYFEDLPTAEISRLLKMKESTVRVYLTRARRTLKDMLEGGGELV